MDWKWNVDNLGYQMTVGYDQARIECIISYENFSFVTSHQMKNIYQLIESEPMQEGAFLREDGFPFLAAWAKGSFHLEGSTLIDKKKA